MRSASDLKESLTERFSTFFRLSGSEAVYVVVLTAVLVFFTSLGVVSAEPVPSSAMIIQHYGFPFEIFSKIITLFNGRIIFHGEIDTVTFMKTTTQFNGIGLVLNPLIYATLSFVIVKAVGKIREEIEYRRYGD
jgi:hypothetical protein